MKQAKPALSANDESSAVGHTPRRDSVVIDDDGPRNPWPTWAWRPEKGEEILSFMRRCAALQEIDPEGDKRWHAECEHFASWRDAFERQKQWRDADLRLRDKMAARSHATGEWRIPRLDKWLRVGMKLDESTIGQYWLCRTRAELARAELRATDLGASDPEAARNWLAQCQWFAKLLTESWSAECERRELDDGDGASQPDSSDIRRWEAQRGWRRIEPYWRYPTIK
ncbi:MULTISPECIES: hypothetical protein [unclassified Ensifer]|uniref:hypothetical protein n=1 Tax=unclassified Ensifer TaxID=2633371 RepID=UPI000813D77D|nr:MULTISPECIES: hypothetical protein [unclassified Ensifer]OCP23177.1 hypothetical protein BC361_23465 [Ensifer sp. LC54]OCP25005.1 hypothetical protein BC363_21645 [Ensifer sp. LC384]